jgi:hypothetical protein
MALAAAPGWSIWKNGMWDLSDTDNDNIPGYYLVNNLKSDILLGIVSCWICKATERIMRSKLIR